MNDALSTVEGVLGMHEPYLSLKQGVLVTSVVVGGLLGVVITLFVVKNTPRLHLIRIIDVILILGSLLSMVANIYCMICGRVVQGVGCGMSSVVVPLFLKEISPTDIYSIIGG